MGLGYYNYDLISTEIQNYIARHFPRGPGGPGASSPGMIIPEDIVINDERSLPVPDLIPQSAATPDVPSPTFSDDTVMPYATIPPNSPELSSNSIDTLTLSTASTSNTVPYIPRSILKSPFVARSVRRRVS